MSRHGKEARTRKVDHVAAWIVIGLGSLFVLSSGAAALDAITERRWSALLIAAAFLALFGVGVWLAVYLLRRLHAHGR